MQCSLCGSETSLFSEVQERMFFKCCKCEGILLHPSYFLSADKEKTRYQLHQNDVTDLGYQNFVSPIIQAIFEEYENNHIGLDFGSGSGPVITTLLEKKGYNITSYDPFFAPNNKALKKTYDYIVCCEVIEHFYNPFKEFELLFSLLNPNGTLYCKTYIYDQSIDFKSWWYKNDTTHVFFYTKNTLQWITKRFGFKNIGIKKNLIALKK